MKKNRCYPKYSYVILFVLAALMFLFALGPIFIYTNEELYIKIIWSAVMFSFFVIAIIGAMHSMQYYEIKNDEIIVKSILGTIVKLRIPDCYLIIQNLPTFSSSTAIVYKQWICIYLKNNQRTLFKKGCNNSKKHKRIQIIYTEKNAELLSQYIKSEVSKHLIK